MTHERMNEPWQTQNEVELKACCAHFSNNAKKSITEGYDET